MDRPAWFRNFRKRYGSGSGSFKRELVKKPKRVDSLDVEAMVITGSHGHSGKQLSTWRTIALAFQTLDVVYGDMGTSPLDVFSDVFSKVSITSNMDILGALSVVKYTIALFLWQRDGILTPAMSVMSAVSGLQGEIKGFGTNVMIVVSIIILVGLFSIQKFGTSKIGFTFALALAFLWLLLESTIYAHMALL